MATFTAYVSSDLGSPGYFYSVTQSEVITANSSEVRLHAPGNTVQSYQGYFSYSNGGYLNWYGSTLKSLAEYDSSGNMTFQVNGMSIPGSTYYNYSQSNNFYGLKEYAFSGSDVINGSNYRDVLLGFSGNDLIRGNSGADYLNGGLGNDSLDGGSGTDTAVFSGSLSNSTVNLGSQGISVQSSANGYDLLNNIELLQFNDQTVSIAQLASLDDSEAVFRFYNSDSGTHFYTGSADEADSVIRNLDSFTYEGVAFDKNASETGHSLDVFRFYNTSTGTHFYTGSEAEKSAVMANLPSFNYEGVAYEAHSQQDAGTTALYRFYNTQTGTHFYTASETEMHNVKVNLTGTYNYEGVAYYVDIA